MRRRPTTQAIEIEVATEGATILTGEGAREETSGGTEGAIASEWRISRISTI
jgi:hypothetical protein